jgi:hypothetical protein
MLIANEDLSGPGLSEVSVYNIQGTQLNFSTALVTAGYGISGGFFGTQRLNSIPSLSAPCVYVADSGTNDISIVSIPAVELLGSVTGSDTDDGSSNGIGMAVNQNFLYAGYSTSGTIGTFAIQSGCGLTFLGDVPATGLQGGTPSGMAVTATTLVVAYADGSVESFNVSGGNPVSNGDKQNTNGYGGGAIIAPFTTGNFPSGVDITQDGRFAIFGDISAYTTIEVASLAGGRLGKTKVYTVGTGVDAGSIRLSPDQSLIYIANSESGTVTAAFFNPATGVVTPGCASPTLNGFNGRPWLGGVVNRDTTGNGGIVYVAEFGRPGEEQNHGPSSAIGTLSITSNGTSCTLTEVADPSLLPYPGTLSIGVYPPRPF